MSESRYCARCRCEIVGTVFRARASIVVDRAAAIPALLDGSGQVGAVEAQCEFDACSGCANRSFWCFFNPRVTDSSCI